MMYRELSGKEAGAVAYRGAARVWRSDATVEGNHRVYGRKDGYTMVVWHLDSDQVESPSGVYTEATEDALRKRIEVLELRARMDLAEAQAMGAILAEIDEVESKPAAEPEPGGPRSSLAGHPEHLPAPSLIGAWIVQSSPPEPADDECVDLLTARLRGDGLTLGWIYEYVPYFKGDPPPVCDAWCYIHPPRTSDEAANRAQRTIEVRCRRFFRDSTSPDAWELPLFSGERVLGCYGCPDAEGTGTVIVLVSPRRCGGGDE